MGSGSLFRDTREVREGAPHRWKLNPAAVMGDPCIYKYSITPKLAAPQYAFKIYQPWIGGTRAPVFQIKLQLGCFEVLDDLDDLGILRTPHAAMDAFGAPAMGAWTCR